MQHVTTNVTNVECEHYALHLDVPSKNIYACTACDARFEVPE